MKKTIQKSIYTILAYIALMTLHTSALFAATVSPSSGSYNYGSQITLTLAASNVLSGQTAINLDLSFTNATVVSYTAPSGGSWSTALAGTPQCNGTALYSSTKVCAALAKTSGTIVSGESLGTVTIKFDKLTGSSTVVKTSNNEYINGDTDESEIDSGTAATFTVTGTIPDTSLKDPVGRLIALGGVILVVIGLFLYRFKLKNE